MGGSLKNPIFRGGDSRKTNIQLRELPKKGVAWPVSRLKGLGKKQMVFLKGGDALMHTMLLFLKSGDSEKVASSKSSCYKYFG